MKDMQFYERSTLNSNEKIQINQINKEFSNVFALMTATESPR